MIQILALVAILLFCGPVHADGYPPLPGSDPSADTELPLLTPRDGGSNFLAVNVCDLRYGCSGGGQSMSGTVKFVLDQEFEIIRLRGFPDAGLFGLVGTFRAASWWDLWDALPGSRSAPFLETNYQPGGELTWRLPTDVHRYAKIRAGFVHQSNGVGDVLGNERADESRSWNRAYFGMTLAAVEFERVSVSAIGSFWVPIGDAPVNSWDGATISDYVGFAEGGLSARLNLARWTDWFLAAKARPRAVEIEFRWRLKSPGLIFGSGNALKIDAVSSCYFGRGERLLTAEQLTRSCYVGVGF